MFTAIDDDIEEVATNRRMFQNVIDAHGLVSSNLQFVAFAGGTRVSRLHGLLMASTQPTKGYGIYLPGGVFHPPLTEDMVNNIPADYAKTVVYPAYRDMLSAASRGKDWTWCEVCPDTIVSRILNGETELS